MGLFGRLLNIITFGRYGEKKSVKPKEEARPLPKVQVNELQNKELPPEMPPEPYEADKFTEDVLGTDYINEQNKERFDKFRERQKARTQGKKVITAAKRVKLEKAATPKEVIKTNKYTTQSELINSKFEIYRNLILKHINSNQLVQDIYQSGILDNRIVAYIYISGTMRWKSGLQKMDEHVIDML